MRTLNRAPALRAAGAGLSVLLSALASAEASGEQPLLSQQSPNYQPPPNYQQPPPNYQQPPPNYQQPPPNYQQPPPNYQAPPPPPPQYQQPSTQAKTAQASAAQQNTGLQYHPFRFQIEGGYTLTEGSLKGTLNDGGNVGAGITWFPFSAFPLGLRVDGSYSSFDLTKQALANAGSNISYGQQNVYGGDADAELDLPMTPHAREYFFGGFGWYRTQTVLKQSQYEEGLICGFFYCEPGQIPVVTTSERTTGPWVKSWNAGIGFEFALSDPCTLFIDARFLEMQPYSAKTQFIPIRIGLRF